MYGIFPYLHKGQLCMRPSAYTNHLPVKIQEKRRRIQLQRHNSVTPISAMPGSASDRRNHRQNLGVITSPQNTKRVWNLNRMEVWKMIFPFQKLGDVQVKQPIRQFSGGSIGFIMSWWPSQFFEEVLHRIGGFTDAFSNNHGSRKRIETWPLLEPKLVLQEFFHFHDDGRKSITFKWNHKWFAQFHADHSDDFDALLKLKSNGGKHED